MFQNEEEEEEEEERPPSVHMWIRVYSIVEFCTPQRHTDTHRTHTGPAQRGLFFSVGYWSEVWVTWCCMEPVQKNIHI